ncbi:MAG TPA: hypothetical protein VJR24_00975 [Gemmatimonadaceae bacterium]|nr:hypothetical protein [Gaiellaceae bacterium]HKS78087.1 hypothetical protein [Gaiellaceae bacterium]HKT06438.1 hypothetical protein [Gemmatimonadaceae bacterium]
MNKTLWIKLAAALTVCAAAAGATFIAAAFGGASSGGTPIAFGKIGNSATGGGDPSAVLAAAVKQVPDDTIASASIVAPPAGAANPNLPWLHVAVRVPSLQNGLDVRPMWIADLVQGELAEGIGTSSDLHAGLEGSTFDAVLPDGTIVPDESGGMGDVVRGQTFSTGTASQVSSAIAAKLQGLGLKPVSIDVVAIPDAAPEVVAIAPDPTNAAENLVNIEKTLFGDPAQYEGYYLELQAPDGTPFVHASAAFRTGAGRFWIDPRYASVASEKTLGRINNDQRGRR